jgi:hypothetical protein
MKHFGELIMVKDSLLAKTPGLCTLNSARSPILSPGILASPRGTLSPKPGLQLSVTPFAFNDFSNKKVAP